MNSGSPRRLVFYPGLQWPTTGSNILSKMVLGSQELQPQVQATGNEIRVMEQVHFRGWWNSQELSVCPGGTGSVSTQTGSSQLCLGNRAMLASHQSSDTTETEQWFLGIGVQPKPKLT